MMYDSYTLFLLFILVLKCKLFYPTEKWTKENFSHHVIITVNQAVVKWFRFLFSFQVRVVRITESQHKDLVKNGVSKDLEDSVIDALVGFSKIVKLLMEFKKPIVGHNLLLDLLILHNQFYLPLPSKVTTFLNSVMFYSSVGTFKKNYLMLSQKFQDVREKQLFFGHK